MNRRNPLAITAAPRYRSASGDGAPPGLRTPNGMQLPAGPLAGAGLSGPAAHGIEDGKMKVRNSLKSLKSRHRDCRVVRRKGRVYVINKTQRRFKARQG